MNRTVLTQVAKTDLALIADGGAVLGAGGGGDPYIGRLKAENAVGDAVVPIASIDDLDDDALILPVAMTGAPQVMQEKFPATGILRAWSTRWSGFWGARTRRCFASKRLV